MRAEEEEREIIGGRIWGGRGNRRRSRSWSIVCGAVSRRVCGRRSSCGCEVRRRVRVGGRSRLLALPAFPSDAPPPGEFRPERRRRCSRRTMPPRVALQTHPPFTDTHREFRFRPRSRQAEPTRPRRRLYCDLPSAPSSSSAKVSSLRPHKQVLQAASAPAVSGAGPTGP